jgi:23S rRNA (uridine2552-2'-O)-methyltransferase
VNPYKRPDHYTKKAKAEGYAARSVFKLDEIARRTDVVPRVGSALDLGCFPGSWSRWLLGRGLRVVGVDLQAPALPDGTFIAASVYDVDEAELLAALGGPAALVVSDMAPSTTGNRFADHVRQIALADRALELARRLGAPGSGFVVKVFDGPDAPAYTARVRAAYADLRRVKPDATRDNSVEFFLVGKGRR